MTASASRGGAPSRRQKKASTRTTEKAAPTRSTTRRNGAPPRLGSPEYIAEKSGTGTTSGASARRGTADITTRPGSSSARSDNAATTDDDLDTDLLGDEAVAEDDTADESTDDDHAAPSVIHEARRPAVARLAEAHTIEATSLGSRRPSRSELLGVAAAFFLIVVSAGIAYAVGSRSADVWSARSEIEYRGESFVETAALTASSRTAISAVAAEFNLPIDEVTESFIVTQAPNSEIIRLEFQAEDDDTALGVLDALTTAFMTRVGDGGIAAQIEVVQSNLDQLQERLAPLELAVRSLDAETATSPAAASRIDELGVLRDQVAVLELRLVDLELRLIDEVPIVVTAPYLDPEPITGAPLRTAALGALAGAAIATAAAVALKR